MANDVDVATLRVGFASQLGKPSIKITIHPESSDPTLGIPLRVYPPDVALVASVGTITKKSVYTEEIQGELLRFSGSSEAKFTYTPSELPPPAEFVFGFNNKGEQFLIPPLFEYDVKNGIVRAYRIVAGNKIPVEVYGLVRVPAYRAEYLKFYYKPAIDYQKTGMIGIYGAIVTFGVIAAYKEGTIELFEVPASSVSSGKYRNEIYRIVSNTVIDPSGDWELPETWGPSYAGRFNDDLVGPQYDTSVVKERIHEYGYIDSYGFFHYEVFRRYLLKPYDSPPTKISNANTLHFQPKIEMISKNPKDVFTDEQKLLQERVAGYIAKRKTYDLILSDYQQLSM